MSNIEISCGTCRNYLGGIYACCRLNLEAECATGDHEAWEPKHKTEEATDNGNNGGK